MPARRTVKRAHKSRRVRHKKRAATVKRNKHGGEMTDEYKQKNAFRRTLHALVSQIAGRNASRNKVKDGITALVRFFDRNPQINTLVPVSMTGDYVDKLTSHIAVVDFVSPVTFMLDHLDGMPDKDIVRILTAYFTNGGNFNGLSSRFKESPFVHEVKKQRVHNVRLLLNRAHPFHIIEDGLDEVTKDTLAQLIPNQQRIQPPATPDPITSPPRVQLTLPTPIPETGYDRSVAPAFWSPLFPDGEELMQIRDSFMGLYEHDRYTSDVSKRFSICSLLERMVPSYLTRYTLEFRESPKTLVNVNVANCFITLLYGMVLYRLYDTQQDYLFIFKGGRALQLSLVDIADVGQYFSEDTDILIVPNPTEPASRYDADKMTNLSEHIAYLVKWMMPEDISILVSLSTNPKNTNKDITKLLYNDGRLFKALSDIGFGEIHDDVQRFFDHYVYSPMYADHFETTALFITPTLDDMLAEKLFFYSLYFRFQTMLERREPILQEEYASLTREQCAHFLLKFKRAILKLVDAVLRKEYAGATDIVQLDSKKIIVREILQGYHDFANEDKELIVSSLYPTF